MAKLANALDLKSNGEIFMGSNPIPANKYFQPQPPKKSVVRLRKYCNVCKKHMSLENYIRHASSCKPIEYEEEYDFGQAMVNHLDFEWWKD